MTDNDPMVLMAAMGAMPRFNRMTGADDVVILSTDNIIYTNLIKLYPNPVIEVIHLDSKIAFKYLEIIDLNGKIVWTQNNPQKRDAINVTNLSFM